MNGKRWPSQLTDKPIKLKPIRDESNNSVFFSGNVPLGFLHRHWSDEIETTRAGVAGRLDGAVI